MFSLVRFIPQVIRNHPVIAWISWSVALAIVVAMGTSKVLNNTTLAQMKGRNEGLTADIANLREENRTAQSRYDTAQASREETISKRVAELSVGYREQIKSLEEQNEKLLLENASLKSTLNELSSRERQQATERKETRITKLSATLDENNRQIAEVQQLIYQTSASAGYDRAECGKERTNFYSNICEQASKQESQVRALQEKISLLEKQGKSLSDQIIALEGKE